MLEGGRQSRLIESRLPGEVVTLGVQAQPLPLNEGGQAGEDVVPLGSHGLGGRLGKRQVALEGLVVRFDFPPSVVDRRELPGRKRRVAGDQIDQAHAAVPVREDLPHQPQGEGNALQPDEAGGLGF